MSGALKVQGPSSLHSIVAGALARCGRGRDAASTRRTRAPDRVLIWAFLATVFLALGCAPALLGAGGEDLDADIAADAIADVDGRAPTDRGTVAMTDGMACQDPDDPLARVSRSCRTGCGEGVETCIVNRWTPCSAPTPEAEVCDGRDNDCDGAVDEELTRPCDGGCGVGVETCRGGSWGTCSTPSRRAEECNGVDDDCDGVADEGLMRACTGACGAGVERCETGRWVGCSVRQPRDEECNGIDDDCDGVTDEDLARSCSTACGSGTQRCAAGAWGACSAPPAQAEVCNGRDDNCNGRVDEDVSRPCSGVCGGGYQHCSGGSWGGCTAPVPQAETCNGRDDNCNGSVDEGVTAPYTFRNHCRRSSLLVAFGCNVCRNLSCRNDNIPPGTSRTYQFRQGVCYDISVLIRSSSGADCADTKPDGSHVGEVLHYCNRNCMPDFYDIWCPSE